MKTYSLFPLLAFSLAVILLCACDNTKTITVLGENSSNLQAMQALKGRYEKSNNIRIEYKPNTFEDAFNKANQDFSNQSGLYDIVLQYNFSLSNFVRNNYVYRSAELSKSFPEEQKKFEADIFPNVWKEVGYYYDNPSDSKSKNIGGKLSVCSQHNAACI
ncbi:MAG: hypothetical protein JKY70_02260 [Mucilaginibacter sp.]|nr:hypothetical protein [Mucilaginibacter sp.]